AQEIDAAFSKVWRDATGEAVRRTELAPAPAGSSWAGVLANARFLGRHRIGRAIRFAIAAAKKRIDIAHAYFLPDRWTRRALEAACARGVEVRMLLPAICDVEIVHWASRRLYEE